MKSGSHWSVDKIYLDGFHLFEQVSVDHKGDSLFCEKGVIIPRFIQNQAQRGPRSATFVKYDPDGRDGYLVFQGIFDHLAGLFRNFKH